VQEDADLNLKKAVERKGTGAREIRGNRIPLSLTNSFRSIRNSPDFL